MAGRLLRSMAVLVALATAITGCGSSSSPEPAASVESSPVPPESTPPPSLESEPAPTTPSPHSAIEQAVYFLEGDSTGQEPSTGTRIMLLFEPGGRAALFATSETDSLGHHGTWRYEDGQLSLKFTAEDFKPEAAFALDLEAETVTMPFAVFATAPGTSTWRRGALSLAAKASAVFGAYGADPDTTVSPDQAIDQAVAATQALVGSDDPADELPLAAGELPALALTRLNRGPDVARGFDATLPKIKSVAKIANGLHVEYEDFPAVDVALLDFSSKPSTTTALVPGPISSDPRVRLDPKPSDHVDDPASKKAVFIVPHVSRRYPGGLWTQALPDGIVKWLGGPIVAGGDKFQWQRHARQLENLGYSVSTLIDDEITLVGLLEALGAPSGPAPGVVFFMSHGAADGGLEAGIDLGSTRDRPAAYQNYYRTVGEAAEKFPDLLTFEGADPEIPKTLGFYEVPLRGDTLHSELFLMLTPAFWRWLASHDVRFHDSLVFLSACWSGSNPELRDAISAKAFFSWTGSPWMELAGAAADYVIDSMVRPTHTSEEAYYNIARIVTTGQRIYDEDEDFKGALARPFPTGPKFFAFFRGWAWDGSTMIQYALNGWLDGEMNPGNVWWLLFAGRWSQKAGDGAGGLAQCEKEGWPVGPNALFCNSAAPGGRPSTDEVGYATYVLTGEHVVPYSGTPIPRLTLRDGRP